MDSNPQVSGDLGKFKVLAPIDFTDEKGEKLGELEVGSIQEVPVELGNGWVEQGLAEVFTLEEEESEEETTEEATEERAANEYELKGFDESDSQTVVFYELNEDGSKQDGTTVEAVIQVAIARLTELNSRFQSPFNEHALSALNEAMHQLNERTRERVARGVEGTHQA